MVRDPAPEDAPEARARLQETVGRAISRLQDTSGSFDELAAEVLAIDKADLPCMAHLLFAGAATVDGLAGALHVKRSRILATVDRLQLAGYARPRPDEPARIELTEHAREWLERIWAPVTREGYRLLEGYSRSELALLADFLRQASAVQERVAGGLRAWLELPSSPARRSHLRGGLSPAALRRVQVFVESSLSETIRLRDLAERAGLSPYHFARAFRRSAGMTPRAFVELRRVERARRLLAESTLPIAEIAIEAGFGSQSRLTTAFKRAVGFTPAAFRRGSSRDR